MSLTAAGLSSAIQEVIDEMTPEDRASQDVFWDALSEAIIVYLKANTVVSVSVATTGTAAAQTGTGTGTIS